MSNMAKTSHFFLYHCHLHNVSKLTCYAARRNIVRNVVLRYSCYMWHTSCYATLATCGTRRVTLLLLHVAHVVLRYSCYMWHTSCVTLLLLHVAHVVLRYSCYTSVNKSWLRPSDIFYFYETTIIHISTSVSRRLHVICINFKTRTRHS
jgi:hypothetical protein